jgi:hypothetical protein
MQVISLHRPQISIDLVKAAAGHGQPESSSEGDADQPTEEETEVENKYVQTIKEVTAYVSMLVATS